MPWRATCRGNGYSGWNAAPVVLAGAFSPAEHVGVNHHRLHFLFCWDGRVAMHLHWLVRHGVRQAPQKQLVRRSSLCRPTTETTIITAAVAAAHDHEIEHGRGRGRSHCRPSVTPSPPPPLGAAAPTHHRRGRQMLLLLLLLLFAHFAESAAALAKATRTHRTDTRTTRMPRGSLMHLDLKRKGSILG